MILLLVGLVLGAVIALASYGMGVSAGRRQITREHPVDVPQSLGPCSCDHPQSLHPGGTGACQYAETKERKQYPYNQFTRYCPCQLYIPKERPASVLDEIMKELP